MDEYGYMIPTQHKTNHLCYSKSDLGPGNSGYGLLADPLTSSYSRLKRQALLPLAPPLVSPLATSLSTLQSLRDMQCKQDKQHNRYTYSNNTPCKLSHAHSECDILDRQDDMESESPPRFLNIRLTLEV